MELNKHNNLKYVEYLRGMFNELHNGRLIFIADVVMANGEARMSVNLSLQSFT